MKTRKKLLSLLATVALLATMIAVAIPLSAGAAADPYEGADVKWDGPLTVDTVSIGGYFGSSKEQKIPSTNFAGREYLLFTAKNNTGVPALLFYLTLISREGASNYTLKPAEGMKYEVMASGESTWMEQTTATVNVAGAGPMITMQVPAGESVVRIPLDSTTLSGAAAGMSNASAENDQYTLSMIDRLEVYACAPGAGADKTVSLVKFAVGGKKIVPGNPAYKGADVKWDGPLTVDTASIGGHFGSSTEKRIPSTNFAGEGYLLFTAKNNTGVPAQLFYLTFISRDGAAGYTLKLAEGMKYEIMASGESTWAEQTTATVNVAGAGPMITMQVPAGESVVRIPLDSTTLSGAAAGMPNASAENDQHTLGMIDSLEVYACAPGAGEDKTVALEKFAVAEKPVTPPPGPGNPEGPTSPATPKYTETDAIQLNPGEKAYFITGFEDGDGIDFLSPTSQINAAIVSAGANNGKKALKFTFVDGSQNGFTTFTLNTKPKANWSGAKYIQFYLKNDSRGGSPLQLFYVKFDGRLLDYPAKGIMLYDMATSKWTETTMQPNFAHFLPGREGEPGCDSETGTYYVPSINIQAGFEGYVRIPLTDGNFDKALNLTNVENIELYAIIPGVAGNAAAYIDDYALVTYEGDKAPDYVDGKPKEDPNPTPGGDEKPEKPFILSGKIVDMDGKPLANAGVTLSTGADAVKRTFVTDANGQFRFEDMKAGQVELTVTGADGKEYGSITYTFNRVEGETKAVGANVDVNADAAGLILQIGMDVLGLDPVSAAEGVLEVTPGTTGGSTDNNDSSNVQTGDVARTIPAFAVCLMALAAVLVVAKRRKA